MSEWHPNPGSDEAVEQGCTCPVIDNARGKGYLRQEGVFVITEGCPVHAAVASNNCGSVE